MTKMPYPKVVVGTLTWNQKSDVLECLESLEKLDYPNYEIVVVDNGSSDGTLEAIRERFPRVAIVRNTENLGCAEGVNGEIRYALERNADYLFIIANDAKVEPSTLSELVRAAESDSRIGAVFPKVYYWGTNRIWYAQGQRVKEIRWFRGQFPGFVQNVEDDGSFDEEKETELFPGGFCLVRIEAVRQAGLLDPLYFIFNDDDDWLYRIHKAGYTGRFVPSARAWHKPSSSVGKESPMFYYYRTRNRLLFFKKHSTPLAFLTFFLCYFPFELVRDLYCLQRSGMKGQLRAMLAGVFDFMKGKFGKWEHHTSPPAARLESNPATVSPSPPITSPHK